MADITVAIVAPGAMGAAVGRRLVENGVRVTTSLSGRSAASVDRARQAGLEPVDDERLVADADIILSIVPPGSALSLAERLAPFARGAASARPLYVDCNAVAPATVRRIAACWTETKCPFIDAGIIGGPPVPGKPSPKFYVAGGEAHRLELVRAAGLDVRVLDGPIGAASALKMSYAALTKGLTALGAAAMLGATRGAAADALRAELADSQPALLAWLTRQVPSMYPKAYRWVAEMEEIALFLEEDPAARQMFLGAARLYERLAGKERGNEIAALDRFLAHAGRST